MLKVEVRQRKNLLPWSNAEIVKRQDQLRRADVDLIRRKWRERRNAEGGSPST